MEVKGCPFCGHGPKVENILKGTDFEAYFISCVNPDCEAAIKKPYKTEEEAFAAWNHRVEEDVVSMPIRAAETVSKNIVNEEVSSEIYKDIIEKFGEKALWTAIFLLALIDMDTWTFPDYVRVEPCMKIIEYIEQNEKLKKLFKKEGNTNVENKN